VEHELKNILEFWEGKAREHGASYKSSWGDLYCMTMEMDTILGFINDGDTVLDVGCGPGTFDLGVVSRKQVAMRAVDYSAEMIQSARSLAAGHPEGLKGSVSFGVSDVMALDEGESAFDKIVTKRVVINLKTFENQIQAARNIHRALKPGGLFLMSEATQGGLDRLNKLREEFGLEVLTPPWHNLYIDETPFLEALAGLFEVVDVLNFASSYYVGSRVIQPFVKGLLKKDPDYLSEINRFFSMVPQVGDYGIQKLFVLKKK